MAVLSHDPRQYGHGHSDFSGMLPINFPRFCSSPWENYSPLAGEHAPRLPARSSVDRYDRYDRSAALSAGAFRRDSRIRSQSRTRSGPVNEARLDLLVSGHGPCCQIEGVPVPFPHRRFQFLCISPPMMIASPFPSGPICRLQKWVAPSFSSPLPSRGPPTLLS